MTHRTGSGPATRGPVTYVWCALALGSRLTCCLALLPLAGAALAGPAEEWAAMKPISPRGYVCSLAEKPPAIDGKLDMQAVDYAKLRQRLLADKQVLEYAAPPRPGAIAATKLPGVVVDDDAAERKGFEAVSSSLTPYVGTGYVPARAQAAGPKETAAEVALRLHRLDQPFAADVAAGLFQRRGQQTNRCQQREMPGAIAPAGRCDIDDARVCGTGVLAHVRKPCGIERQRARVRSVARGRFGRRRPCPTDRLRSCRRPETVRASGLRRGARR